MNTSDVKPRNSDGFRFVSKQRKRTLKRRGEAVYYDYSSGFFVWRTSWTTKQLDSVHQPSRA